MQVSKGTVQNFISPNIINQDLSLNFSTQFKNGQDRPIIKINGDTICDIDELLVDAKINKIDKKNSLPRPLFSKDS
jgi:hypothetical protein